MISLSIQKTALGLYWTNRYLLDYASPGDAPAEAIESIAAYESLFHGTIVTYTSARLSTVAEGDDDYVIIPLTETGNTASGTEPTPGFCTVRVDLRVPTGRPSRKYYRVFVSDAQMAGQNWVAEYITGVQTTMESLLGLFAGNLVDPDGQVIQDAQVFPQIQMRQLRRGSRRRTEPVIPLA